MLCSKNAIFRFADAIFLAAIFLFQSVIFNYFIIKYFSKSSLPFLWFLGDFFCLLVFSFTLFLAYRVQYKRQRKERLQTSASNSSSFISNPRTNSRQSSENEPSGAHPITFACFGQVAKLPLSYVTWIVYSTIMIAKLVVLVKADIPQTLSSDEVFGSSLLKIAIAISSIIFYLLVEAHHDAHEDPVRNAYINSVSYSTAIEILDTTTFFSLLLEKENHLMFSYHFENFILTLSSINLMLPSLALYKLTVSNFGKTYPVALEVLNKVLHFFLVNVSYCGVRLYLRNWYGASDTSIFFIKNIYAMIAFFRGIYPDLKKLEVEWENTVNFKKLLQPFQHRGDVSISANGKTKSLTEIREDENIPMGRPKPKHSTTGNEDDHHSVA